MAQPDSAAIKDAEQFALQWGQQVAKQDNGLLMVGILLFGIACIAALFFGIRYIVRKERRDQEFRDNQLKREQDFRDRQELRQSDELARIQESRSQARSDLATTITTEISRLSKEFADALDKLRDAMQQDRGNASQLDIRIVRLEEKLAGLMGQMNQLAEDFKKLKEL